MAKVSTSTPPTHNNHFSTSTSSMRASHNAHSAPRYSDNFHTTLPSIDIPFDDLRKRMNEFSLKFDAFLEKGRKKVLEERNEFLARVGEMNEDKQSTTSRITALQHTLSTHTALLTRETDEKEDLHASISNLEQHQSSQLAQREKLRAAIAAAKRGVDAKLAAQTEFGRRCDEQGRMNGPELMFWETYLGTRIEGISGGGEEGSNGEDEGMVKVTFSFPAKKSNGTTGLSETEREAWFELKVPETTAGSYEVVGMKPRLERGKVERVVSRLNETREIRSVLKGMRGLFVEEMR